MTTILEPVPVDYTILLSPKSIGGSIEFLKAGTPKRIRFIDTFELNISMFVILDDARFSKYVGSTIFSLRVTYANGTTEDIWSYQVHDIVVGFTLARSFFDFQEYKDITGIYLVAENEITLNNHDFIAWNGHMKIIEKVCNTFIGGDLHVSDLTSVTLNLTWGQTNYNYAIVNWGDGVTTGIVSPITISAVYIGYTGTNVITVNWGTGNYSSIIIIYNNKYLVKYATGNSYSILNLTPNKSYTYSVIPYSIIGVSGTPHIITAVTLPTIGTATSTNIDANTVNIAWDGGIYAYVTIIWKLSTTGTLPQQEGIVVPAASFNSYYIAGISPNIPASAATNYTITGLVSNIAYNFFVMPVNLIDVAGDYSATGLVTFATVGDTNVSIVTETTARVSWGNGTYTSITILVLNGSVGDIYAGIYNTDFFDITQNLVSNVTYTVEAIPINSNGDPNTSSSLLNGYKTVAFTTLATVGNITSDAITSTSVLISWGSGTYSTVNVSWAGQSVKNIAGTSYLITGLTPSTIYTIYVNANNRVGITNPADNPITINTLATIGGALTLNNITFNSMQFSWIKGQSAYDILSWNQSQSPNIVANSYTVQSLTANTLYDIAVVPYNQYNVANLNASDNGRLHTQQTTLANITAFSSTNITTSSATLLWNGTYSNVKIAWSAGASTGTGASTNAGASTCNVLSSNTVYNVSALAPNTPYNFTITPYNSVNAKNTSPTVSTASLITLATLNQTNITALQPTSATLSWSGGAYSSVFLQWFSNSVSAGTYTVPYSSSNYQINGLGINTPYAITATPVNSAGASNVAALISKYTTTLATLTALSVASYDNVSITITWTGVLSSVLIECYKTANLATTTIPPLYVTTALLTDYHKITGPGGSGLLENTGYTIFVTPLNNAGIGNPANRLSTAVVTLSTIGAITTVPKNSTSIEVDILYNTSPYVNIIQTPPRSLIAINYSSAAYTATGLSPNSTYQYTVVPINSANSSNAAMQAVVSRATLATVGTPSILSYTDTTATVAWDQPTSHYNSLNIYWAGNTSGSNLGIAPAAGYTLPVSALVSNGNYTFTLVPVNVENLANPNEAKTQALNTRAVIGNITVAAVRSTSVTLSWQRAEGTYTSVSILWTGTTSGVTPSRVFGEQYTVTGLTPNSIYSFTVTPYNASGVENSSASATKTVAATTLATFISSITLTAASSLTLTVAWTATTATYTNIALYNTAALAASPTAPPLGSVNVNAGTYTTLLAGFAGITPNTNYTVKATPYNSSAAANTDPADNGRVTVAGMYTLATVQSVYIDTILTNTVNLNFGGAFTAVNVNYFGTTSGTINAVAGSPYTVINLVSNGNYTFIITPVNYTGFLNTVTADGGIYTTPMITTLATMGITTIDPTQMSATNVTVAWNGGSYSEIDVLNGAALLYRVYPPAQNVNILNLVSNTLYTFTFIPFNSIGASNVANIQYPSVTTHATVGDVTFTNLTPTAVRVNWGAGTYKYVSAALGMITFNNIRAAYTDAFAQLTPNTLYTATVTPYNNANQPANFGSVAAFTSLATIAAAAVATAYTTISNIRVTWNAEVNYSFVTLQVYLSSNLVIPNATYLNLSGTYFDIPGLVSNVAYTILVVPVNRALAQNTAAAITLTETTLATVGAISINSYDTTTAGFSWSPGTYSSVAINITATSGAGAGTTAINTVSTGQSYMASGLIPNTGYLIRVTPYNSAGVANASGAQTANISEYGTIGNPYVSSVGASNAVISWSAGLYDSAIGTLTRVADNALLDTQSGIRTTIYLIPASCNVITPNVSYVAKITPVNIAGVPNAAGASNVTFVSLPAIGAISLVPTSSNITVSWPTGGGAAAAYSNVDIANQYIGFGRAAASPYVMNGLSANSNYYVTATPMNSYNVSGAPATASIYTLGAITRIDASAITSSSALVSWSGAYSAINLSANSTNILTNYNDGVGGSGTGGGGGSSCNVATLSPNTQYSFAITPFNFTGSVGTTVVSSNIVSLANISTFAATNTTVSATTLVWSGGAYKYLNISATNLYTNATAQYTASNVTSLLISALQENTQYQFSAIPVNSAEVANYPYNTAATTLTTVTGTQVAINSDTSATVTWAPGAYTSVNVAAAPGSLAYNGVVGTTKTLSQLVPNTLYTFTVTPVNQSGTPNAAASNTVTGVTLASLSSNTISNVATNSAQLYWYSTATTVNLNVAAAAGGFQAALIGYGANSNIYIAGLLPNVAYNTTLVPVNSVGATNAAAQIASSFVTLPTIDTAVITAYDATTATIAWNVNPASNIYTTARITGGAAPIITSAASNVATNLLPNTAYNFVVSCFNSAGIENVTARQTLPTLVTRATMNTMTITNVQVYAFTINWNSLNATNYGVDVKIATNNTSVLSTMSSASTLDVITGLSPNRPYNVSVNPYNSAGASNVPGTITKQIYTLGTVSGAQIASTLATSITLQIQGGAYSSNLISWTSSSGAPTGQVTLPTATPTVTGLLPDNYYTFRVAAVNTAGASNIADAVITPQARTKTIVYLAAIPVTNITTTSMTVNWQAGTFTSLIVSWNGSTSTSITTGTSYPITTSVLPNVTYTIIVTPYSIIGAGITATTTATTLPVLTSLSQYAVTSTAITIGIAGSYSYVQISWKDIYGYTQYSSNFAGSVFTTGPAQLTTNMYYTIQVTPYNSVNVAGAALSMYAVTLAIIDYGQITITYVRTTTLYVSWNLGSASTVAVSYTLTGSGNIIGYTRIAGTSLPISGLTPNTRYTFTITPYNSANAPNGAGAYNMNVLTLADIGSLSVASLTPTTVTLTWAVIDPYNYVTVSWYLFNSPTVLGTTANIMYASAKSTQISGLTANTKYTFVITPYNADGVANTTGTTSVSVYTYATIGPTSVLAIDSTTVTLDFTALGSAYNFIVLQWNITGNPAVILGGFQQAANTYANRLIGGLLPNTNYTFSAIPYNVDNVANPSGTQTQSVTAITYAVLYNVATNTTPTTITVSWAYTGTYSYVTILFNGAMVYVIGASYQYNGLPSATGYNIVITPYNSANVPNTPISLFAVTTGNYQFSSFTFITDVAAAPVANTLQYLLNLPGYSGAAWAAANISYFNGVQGYQLWTAPASAYYTIVVAGAAGGKNTSNSGTPGRGTIIRGTFYIDVTTDALIIIPGLSGTWVPFDTYGAGGGGASAVFRYTYATGAITPLMVAAGGGGTAGNGAGSYNGANAATIIVNENTPSGNVGNFNDYTAGCSTQYHIKYGELPYAMATIGTTGITYSANGATDTEAGGFGGGGSGYYITGGGGGSWTGSYNSPFGNGGFGGNTNMIISYAINAGYVGNTGGNGYVTISFA